jgi:two-component system, OmpR family, response regulator QseB
MHVLVVEDDELLGDGMCAGLKQLNYTVDWLKDGKEASRMLQTSEFDIIVLDLGLPGLSGLDLLRGMRNRKGPNQRKPVLILTARDTVEDRVKGLDSGADDYLTKPFDLTELQARMRALQRRSVGRADTKIVFENVEIDPAAHTVTVDGELVSLPRREFALLQKLIEHRGKVLSREQLTQSLYGWEEDVDSNALEVHVHNLRKKLKAKFIRTIRGVGYMVE